MKQASLLSFFQQPKKSSVVVAVQEEEDAVIEEQNQLVHNDDNEDEDPMMKKRVSTSDAASGKKKPTKRLKRMRILSDDENEDDEGSAYEESEASSSSDAEEEEPTAVEKENRRPVPKTPAIAKTIKQHQQPSFTPPGNPYTPRIGQDRKKDRQEKFLSKNEAKYAFLSDIRDANGNRPGEQDYDPRTLFIPKQFWKDATPFEKQYWTIKSQHFDTVVFFKKGKFYELFERDADTGHREFDLKLTDRAHMRMCGVPEASFEFWASKFIARGFKVAKVDQLETQLGKEMRERDQASKKDACIRRELTAVLTGGTIVDGAMLQDSSTYCLAIKEHVYPEGHVDVGVAFVDTSCAEFHVGQWQDDKSRAMLETLLMQTQPKEVIYEKGHLSPETLRLLKNSLPVSVLWNPVISGTEFWDATTTEYEMKTGGYFDSGDDQDSMEKWPSVLKEVLEQSFSMSAFGALVWYLRSLKLDKELLSLGNIKHYHPHTKNALLLDGQTLKNLEIFENSLDGGAKGTLFSLLNRCRTPFGKRMFRRWLYRPLADRARIEARLDAVDDLNRESELFEILTSQSARLPDLERLISRIHAGTCKLKDFLIVKDGYERLLKMMKNARSFADSLKSARLIEILTRLFPYETLESQLKYLDEAFDVQQAKQNNEFIVYAGVEEDFDEISAKIKDLEKRIQLYLVEQKRAFGCSDLQYRDLGQEIFQLQVPIRYVDRVPKDWLKRSSTKTCVRYHSPFLVTIVREYQEAQETRAAILKALFGRMLARFDNLYTSCWQPAVNLLAELDCLCGLADVSGRSGILGDVACRPVFLDDNGVDAVNKTGQFRVTESRHPCLYGQTHSDFIPNDIELGGESAPMILLTGPNMGGKSTMLRQSCILIIMAQLGCYVPARSCEMSLFDRIFTRIGANDNILAGQSTFMVELSETSKILHQATPRSLVILDELGRGTSTFDGYAIAYSVLHHLAHRVRCLGLFSTHYGLLTSEFTAPICPTPAIRCMHMACEVDEQSRNVLFLYRLVDGVSKGSYGMHVAQMAGVPSEVIDVAEQKSREMVQEKGWIGCVGLNPNSNGSNNDDGEAMEVEQEYQPSRSVMLQSDFASVMRYLKKTEQGNDKSDDNEWLAVVKKAASARYQVAV